MAPADDDSLMMLGRCIMLNSGLGVLLGGLDSMDNKIIRELEWALAMILDGVPEHDIQGMTGCSDYLCKEIDRIRGEAIARRGLEIFEKP